MGPELLCLRREARSRDSGTLFFLGMQSLTKSLCVSPLFAGDVTRFSERCCVSLLAWSRHCGVLGAIFMLGSFAI